MFRYLSPLVMAAIINPTIAIAQYANHEFAGSYECVGDVETGIRLLDGRFQLFQPEWETVLHMLVSPDGYSQDSILGEPKDHAYPAYKVSVSKDKKYWNECIPTNEIQRRLAGDGGYTLCMVDGILEQHFHIQFKDGFFIRTMSASISEYGNTIVAGRCERL